MMNDTKYSTMNRLMQGNDQFSSDANLIWASVTFRFDVMNGAVKRLQIAYLVTFAESTAEVSV